MRKYKHLSYEERVEIGVLHRRGLGVRQIAEGLGRSPNTISRELKRKVRGRYTPKGAQHKAYIKRYRAKKDCMKVALDPWLTHNVMEKVKEGWSPERIAGWCRGEGHPVSKSSVYRFVHSRCLERYLFRRRYHRKSGRKPHRAKVEADGRRFVEARPTLPNESGHLEADFVVSPYNSSSLLVVVDRVTRYTRIKRLRDRKHASVTSGFLSLLGDTRVKTLTLDNDISFAHWRDLELALGTKIYFTHPYRSWEKGLVENTNRWIRLFVPKKTDIRSVTDERLREALHYLNEIPRQCLNFKTATEMSLAK